MSIRDILSIGLVTAALTLGGVSRAEDSPKPAGEPGAAAQDCAHHMKAMHSMGSDKQREAYCHAHKDCMSHDCGGMGAMSHEQGPVDPPGPKAKPKQTPTPPKN